MAKRIRAWLTNASLASQVARNRLRVRSQLPLGVHGIQRFYMPQNPLEILGHCCLLFVGEGKASESGRMGHVFGCDS